MHKLNNTNKLTGLVYDTPGIKNNLSLLPIKKGMHPKQDASLSTDMLDMFASYFICALLRHEISNYSSYPFNTTGRSVHSLPLNRPTQAYLSLAANSDTAIA